MELSIRSRAPVIALEQSFGHLFAVELSAGAEPHFLRHLHGSDPFIPGIIKL
jgi:hypothetical protein